MAIKVSREDFEMVVTADEDPDTSFMDQEEFEDRKAEYRRGDFHFVGIRARVTIKIPTGKDSHVEHVVTTPGLWGVESDSEEYHKEVFEEQCDALEDMLRALGTIPGTDPAPDHGPAMALLEILAKAGKDAGRRSASIDGEWLAGQAGSALAALRAGTSAPDESMPGLREDHETLVLARSLIRDLAHGWAPKELAAPPEDVVRRITSLLGDSYDFETGEQGEGPASAGVPGDGGEG